MADRSIVVRLRAQIDGFKREMAEATKAVDQTAKGSEDAAKRAHTAMGRMVQSAQENREAWNTAGATLTGFGAAALGGLGVATKAAMDWESAWAGVQKTVDGTAPQMAALEEGLRGMARELPATHQEIAAVAEAAGQLGIATPNILGFTRTMIDMGEATNLSADQAATALARFITVTGTSQNDIGRLGAAVVGLGNNFATTEAEIVELSQRLAAAGTQAGLSEGEIMGLATAMSQVGINAEAGGTAMTQTMNRISREVESGGDSLELLASVAGMTAADFAAAWENRPAEALVAFTEGLADTSALGMSTNAVLTELGITGLREADTMRRLALATGTMSDAMAMGNEEYERGTALIEEASQRYETAESRISIARNALVDSGISIGAVVLPAFANLADGVAVVAGWFADLPGPVHAATAGIAGAAGAATLGAGSFLLIAPRVLDTVSAFRDLGAISPTTASRVGRLTLGIGKLGGAVALLAAVPPVLNAVTDAMRGIDSAELDLGMNELSSSLLEGERSGQVFDSTLGDLYESGAVNKQMFDDLGSSVQEVANMDGLQRLIGPLAATGVNDVKVRFEGLSDALVMMSQTDLPRAQASFAAFMAEAEAGGATFEQVMQIMPSFRDHLVGVAEGMQVGTDDATLYRIATGELTPVVDEATGAVTGFSEGMEDAADATTSAAEAAAEALQAIQDLAAEFISAERGALDYKDALQEARDAVDENGKAWEDGTEAADENKRALLDLAEQALATAATLEPTNESGTFLAQVREDLIEVATEMTGSKELAEEYVNQLGLTPERVETQVELDVEAAQEEWDTLWKDLGHNPPEVPVSADTTPAEDEVHGFTGTVMNGEPPEVPVGADTSTGEEQVWGFVDVIEQDQGTEVTVGANVRPAFTEIMDLESAITEAGGTVTINGQTHNADTALDTLMAIINSSDGTVTIDGQSVPADEALAAAIEAINNGEGTVDILGDNSDANSKIDASKRKADGTEGTIDVDASTSEANTAINNAARTRYASIVVTYQRANSAPRFGGAQPQLARASGGPIFGPGTGTSDSVPVRASNGEHMLTAAEVALAGGHDAIYRMRAAIRAGAARFQVGGGVEHPADLRMALAGPAAAWSAPRGPSGPAGLSLQQTNHNYGPDADVVSDRVYSKTEHLLRSQASQTMQI